MTASGESGWRGLLRHPLAAPLLAGAAVRVIAATVGSGFHARDDYFHVLEPAYRWLLDAGFDWEASGLPGAGIRSHLLPRLVHALLEVFSAVGVEDPEWAVRGIYLAVGAYGLLVVPAVYFTARRLFGSADARAVSLATWLAALHFAMPYAGTRLLISAFAMPPLVVAIGLAAGRDPRGRDLLLAGLLLGVAGWFRFQVGLAGIGVAGVVAFRAWRRVGVSRAARAISLLVAGAAAAFAVQGLFDLVTTGTFLGPLHHNLLMNLCAWSGTTASTSCVELRHHGLSPNLDLTRVNPFAYLGMWLALTVPPATLILVPALAKAGRRLGLIAWPWLIFVLLHSLIPHKEERFMLPVLPLFLLLGAAVPTAVESGAGRFWRAARAWWPQTRWWLVAVHLLALVITITYQSQAGQRAAIAHLRGDDQARALLSMGPEIPSFLLARESLPVRRQRLPSARWLRDTLIDMAAAGVRPNRFLGFAPDRAEIEVLLSRLDVSCEPPLRFESSGLDRLLYRLNPRHNRRRAAVLLWRCEAPQVAGPSRGWR